MHWRSSLICYLMLTSQIAWAACPVPKLTSESNLVTFGFAGVSKLGVWQPFQIRTPDQIEPKHFEITVIDGDDTPVIYEGELQSTGADLNLHQGWVKLGRRYGDARIKLFDVHGQEVFAAKVPVQTQAGSPILSSTTRLVLTLGPDTDLAKSIDATVSIGRDEPAEVIAVTTPDSLPITDFCYEGIDTIYLSTADYDWLQRVTAPQWDALESWIQNGGRLILSASASSESLLQPGGTLNRFLPGEAKQFTTIDNSSRLESFAEVGRLLSAEGETFEALAVESADALTLLTQDQVPLILHQAYGLGDIVFVAFDLTSERFKQWSGQNSLIHRIDRLNEVGDGNSASSTDNRSGGSVSHFGYEDLIGQLRVALDQFSGVQFIAFTAVALLIAAYIACIGPGDFFFLKSVIRKMEWTWLTFPVIALLFGGATVWIASATRPHKINVNQLTVIDIDSISGHVRATGWTNLYSPDANRYRIDIGDQNPADIAIAHQRLSWQGLPGHGLGGMEAAVRSGVVHSPYRQTIKFSSETVPESAASKQSTAALEDIPLFVSSTKPLLVQGEGHFQGPVQSRLVLREYSQRLDGTFTNPFPVALTNVKLMFENYAYILIKQELEPGETIDVLTEMKERTIRSLLTRRVAQSDDKTKKQNSPWSATDTNLNRIAELMMFFRAAGGRQYTGLTHNYQDFIDMSDCLYLKRAVLVGTLAKPGIELQVDGQAVSENYDKQASFIRVVLPVTYESQHR